MRLCLKITFCSGKDEWLLVNQQVVVELKAKRLIHPVDKAQVLSHLRSINLTVGLLIIFHEVKLVDGVSRIINRFQEDR